ncbi:protein NRT1/ PTR FAMILY 1.2-like isoform X1 [Tripterygium wilfordii]|uniref:protein NRT1/ PTR FAMILY 1.2-like isoform X1 n=1 Tax=Tripterygium wilfordii TaxID=458696 RepID=UPI0018F85E3F|nr:protein NRT1/ PTR FAMILY 1.2-like isoform X1 [Tripterygium wilfordii]
MTSDEEKTLKEPLLVSKQKGGFRTLPFIIVNESFEKVASYGLLPNMVLYLTMEYRLENSTAVNILFLWSAATNLLPIIGAFLADSYVGRYPMIAFGSIASLLGMTLLWSTAMIPGARPPPCNQFSDSCESPTMSQLLVLYICFGIMSVGAGGIRSSSLAFGADQLVNREKRKSSRTLESYFSWYYFSVSVSVIVALTCVVYIQENLGWKVGFGVPVVLMFFSTLSFFLASCWYVKLKDKASLVTGFAHVLVASYRNRDIQLSGLVTDEMYYHGKESMLHVPSEKLRCLNKACVIRNPHEDLTPDGSASNPWILCTVDKVEELKALIKVIPFWFAGVLRFVNLSQSSFLILQASSMDRHITSNFEIPAGSFFVFYVLSLAAAVALYDRIILPLSSTIKGRPVRLSLKCKMGVGIFLSGMSMAVLAVVEYILCSIAMQEGASDRTQAVGHMSAMWLVPHYVLLGLAEAFVAIGENEFFYSELPKSMSSIASNISLLGLAVANLLASFIVNVVDTSTKTGGAGSWVSSDINKGHYDYYYGILFVLSMVNFLYYVVCCKAYGPCKGESNHKDLAFERVGSEGDHL